MFEYRLIYLWDAEHWTCISAGISPVKIYHYILNNLEEMRDAAAQTFEEEGIAECYAIEVYKDKDGLVHKWEGTPDYILEVITKITDDWLSLQ